jgi:hypothetical protein
VWWFLCSAGYKDTVIFVLTEVGFINLFIYAIMAESGIVVYDGLLENKQAEYK